MKCLLSMARKFQRRGGGGGGVIPQSSCQANPSSVMPSNWLVNIMISTVYDRKLGHLPVPGDRGNQCAKGSSLLPVLLSHT